MSNIEQLHKGVMTELLEFLNICFTGRADSRHFEDRYSKFWLMMRSICPAIMLYVKKENL